MTFPVYVSASTINTDNAAGTSHAVNLPAAVDVGDRLIAVLHTSGAAGGITWDDATVGAWTQIYNLDTSSADSSGACYERIADGTEDAAALTITTVNSIASQAVVFRVSGAHASAAIEVATLNTINSASHDPPLLTPSWGAQDTLWLALAGQEGGTRWYSGFPADYVDTGYFNHEALPGAVIGYAWRSINATSQDPSTFTSSATNRCIVATLAIRPVAAGGSTGRGRLVGGKLVGGNLLVRAA
jgi:hypothetical protein